MIKTLLILCLWIGTVDVTEGDTLTVELVSVTGEMKYQTLDTSEFPCNAKEGTRFVMTVLADGGRPAIWCTDAIR